MPSGRIFRFIGFNATENANKVCTFAPKKMIIGRILAEVIFGAPAASKKLFRIIFQLFRSIKNPDAIRKQISVKHLHVGVSAGVNMSVGVSIDMSVSIGVGISVSVGVSVVDMDVG